VGDEKKVPNWLYAIAYQRIASSPGSTLEFACHAGEYFADQMEGVRRIAEVALFTPANVRRVGHCLALETSSGVDSRNTVETGTLLEDVIWSVLVLGGRNEARLAQGTSKTVVSPELVRKLKRVILQLASTVFGTKTSVEDVRRWYLGRFETATMARWLPQLQMSPAETTSWPRGMERGLLPKPTGLLDGMLAASVYAMSVDVHTSHGVRRVDYNPAARPSGDVLAEARSLLTEAGDYAVKPVQRWLRSRKIVIESCPSSNAALAELPITRHPVWAFHKAKLRCSINTDDPALFGSSLVEEYAHAGMVAENDGGEGDSFVSTLATTSRTEGMIARPLCRATETPVLVYRALLG